VVTDLEMQHHYGQEHQQLLQETWAQTKHWALGVEVHSFLETLGMVLSLLSELSLEGVSYFPKPWMTLEQEEEVSQETLEEALLEKWALSILGEADLPVILEKALLENAE